MQRGPWAEPGRAGIVVTLMGGAGSPARSGDGGGGGAGGCEQGSSEEGNGDVSDEGNAAIFGRPKWAPPQKKGGMAALFGGPGRQSTAPCPSAPMSPQDGDGWGVPQGGGYGGYGARPSVTGQGSQAVPCPDQSNSRGHRDGSQPWGQAGAGAFSESYREHGGAGAGAEFYPGHSQQNSYERARSRSPPLSRHCRFVTRLD